MIDIWRIDIYYIVILKTKKWTEPIYGSETASQNQQNWCIITYTYYYYYFDCFLCCVVCLYTVCCPILCILLLIILTTTRMHTRISSFCWYRKFSFHLPPPFLFLVPGNSTQFWLAYNAIPFLSNENPYGITDRSVMMMMMRVSVKCHTGCRHAILYRTTAEEGTRNLQQHTETNTTQHAKKRRGINKEKDEWRGCDRLTSDDFRRQSDPRAHNNSDRVVIDVYVLRLSTK